MTEQYRSQTGPGASFREARPTDAIASAAGLTPDRHSPDGPTQTAQPEGEGEAGFAVRRVVTGHDTRGKSIVLSDGPSPFVFSTPLLPGYVSCDIFRTFETPAHIVAQTVETTSGPRRQLPTPRGTVIRVSQVPPYREGIAKLDSATASQAFKSLGNAGGHTATASARNATMHRTETIDYVVVLSGELTLLLDDSEVVLHAGDVLVQCGTNHTWENRSQAPATVMFVLMSGAYDQALREILPDTAEVKTS
ncbi:cupin domain-containing protein [Paraburkholderia phenazinium]|uniref:Cupin domain-containing protein n=1 Tax=Paraburkholderia phenazinium TaxID=60549 RepID=A0A1G8FVK2_9BURK|nr:cupin domain-containing protein [Paraburkholderia phenazinium]SDH86152.1 Cupin domain-containing protein [Paraburkholderia phenazinium]